MIPVMIYCQSGLNFISVDADAKQSDNRYYADQAAADGGNTASHGSTAHRRLR